MQTKNTEQAFSNQNDFTLENAKIAFGHVSQIVKNLHSMITNLEATIININIRLKKIEDRLGKEGSEWRKFNLKGTKRSCALSVSGV